VKIVDMWTKNRKYRRYIGIADIFSSKISISYRFWKSGIDPSLLYMIRHPININYPCKFVSFSQTKPDSVIKNRIGMKFGRNVLILSGSKNQLGFNLF